jgi:hypothetical protein
MLSVTTGGFNLGLRGPHAGPKSVWRYIRKPVPKVRCSYCYRLFSCSRSDAQFCGAGCRQAAHREKTEMDTRKTFVLVLRPEKHVTDPVRMLRALLKIAKQQFGLKAERIREETMNDAA